MATITVKDGNGTSQTVNVLPAVGQAGRAASLPVALSSEDAALLASPALPNGAATASGVAAVVTALGTPLQAGGTVVTDAGSAANAFAVTTSDSANFSNVTRALYVGVGGDVVAVVGGTTVTFKSVPTGAVLPVKASRVNATNTTATNMVGLY